MTKEQRNTLFDDYVVTMKQIMDGKGNDYANQDVLSNFKIAGSIANQNVNHPAGINCINAIATKIARLGNLLQSEGSIVNESIADSIIDLTNYSFLLYCIMSEDEHA